MVTWRVLFTRQARADAKKFSASGMQSAVEELLDILREDPFRTYPPYEMLVGDLLGAYSRRINIQHRLVYQVLVQEQVVKIIRLWLQSLEDGSE
jgi:toxin YoeB